MKKDLRAETAKKSGRANAQKAAEKVLKSAKADKREALHGAWTDAEGRQCICDAIQAYRLKDALPLEELPAHVSPVDLSRIFPRGNGVPLPLPDLGELRAFIKTEKARLKAQKDKSAPVWDFGDGLPALNAEYLLIALELLPECTAEAANDNATVRAVYFNSASGDGMVCPVVRKAPKQ